MPFFPRILVHLVGLGPRVAQRVAVEPGQGVALEAVPQLEQMGAVADQLAGQRRRRHPLGDAAEDRDDLRGPPLNPLEGRPGPGVEGAAAMAALVVEHGVATTAMDPEAVACAAARAGQAVGVEEGDEPVVAGLLVEQIDDGGIHRRASRPPNGGYPERTTRRVSRQVAEHQPGHMSQWV
jgi:hypothetical protein